MLQWIDFTFILSKIASLVPLYLYLILKPNRVELYEKNIKYLLLIKWKFLAYIFGNFHKSTSEVYFYPGVWGKYLSNSTFDTLTVRGIQKHIW